MLQPAREKFRKCQPGRRRGIACRGTEISFGEYGLKAVSPGWVTANQIEAARIAVTRCVKRGAKVWIRVFPHKPVTSKPAESRMGKGKGAPDRHVAVVKPGHILFEIEGVPRALAQEAMRLAGHKLPIRTRFVVRGETSIE
jgi:large subunit ribosomal protein L16